MVRGRSSNKRRSIFFEAWLDILFFWLSVAFGAITQISISERGPAFPVACESNK